MNISSDSALRALVGILVISFIVLAGPFIVFSMMEKIYLSTLTSELRYTVTITTTSPLSDATFFIPLPADKNGVSPVIEKIGMENRIYISEGWNASIFGANNESYLKVWTELVPGPADRTEITHSFTVTAASPALQTRNPLIYDYTLLPKQDLAPVTCGTNEYAGHPDCYQFRSMLYASYRTSSNTRVELQADLLGSNQWDILGSYSNEYTDHIQAAFQGPVKGWHIADGQMNISIGDENPFWKEQVETKIRTKLTVGVNTTMMRWHTFTPLP